MSGGIFPKVRSMGSFVVRLIDERELSEPHAFGPDIAWDLADLRTADLGNTREPAA